MAFGIDDALIAGGPVVGGVVGGILGQSGRDQAMAARQAALAKIGSLNAPNMSVDFNNYKQVGQLNPALEQTLQQAQTEAKSVQSDPGLIAARNQALGGLQQVANNGGMTLQDKANLNQILSQSAAQEAGSRGAVMQNMAQRGMGGSGFQLAAMLANQQGAASNASQNGLNVAAQAQNRALQAMQQGGSLANQYNQADVQQAMQKAKAQDLINQFNTQNAQGVAGQNVNRQNGAQQYNLGVAQETANANTGLSNQQQVQNNAYRQQTYSDQLNQAKAYGDAANGVASQAQANGNALAGVAGGVGQGLGEYGAQNKADQRWQGLTDALQAKKKPQEDDQGGGGYGGASLGVNTDLGYGN